MTRLLTFFRPRSGRAYVRPWALATPVAVLLVCLPFLRPLHHPGQMTVDEQNRLATISALVDNSISQRGLADRLALDPQEITPDGHLIQSGKRLFSDQPAVLAFLMSGPAWVLAKMGYTLRANPVLVPYLLTLLGSTLPAAAGGGLVYRMGRLFELARPWRAALAAASVFATGLVSYAVVLNPHVPAAVLVLAAVGCLAHLSASPEPWKGGGWIMMAGLSAALAAAIDPPAVLFLVLLLIVVPTLQLRKTLRIGGMMLYLLGAMPAIILHSVLTIPITGDLLPGTMHPEMAATPPAWWQPTDSDVSGDDTSAPPAQNAAIDPADEVVAHPPQTFWESTEDAMDLFFAALLGEHGILAHFPVVLLGIAGMLAVMHRHWPATTKLLAAGSAGAVAVALIACAAGRYAVGQAAYANQWFILFLPILLFWAGAWIRRAHLPATWALAGVLLAFSVTVTLIGLIDPMPPGGYDQYTPVAAVRQLTIGEATPGPTMVADQ